MLLMTPVEPFKLKPEGRVVPPESDQESGAMHGADAASVVVYGSPAAAGRNIVVDAEHTAHVPVQVPIATPLRKPRQVQVT